MLKSRRNRLLLATFGSVAMLAGTAGPAMASTFRAMLNGDNELSAGDTDGWGRVNVNVNGSLNQLCADIEVRSLGRINSVDIHRGGPGVDGPPVVHLDRPEDRSSEADEDDCDRIGDALADQISSNPGEYYVQVRTAEFPRGAIRGQLVPSGD